MSEIMNEPQGGMTQEEIEAMEAERKAAWDAKIAPFKNLKKRLDDVEEVVTTMVEGML